MAMTDLPPALRRGVEAVEKAKCDCESFRVGPHGSQCPVTLARAALCAKVERLCQIVSLDERIAALLNEADDESNSGT